MLYRCENKATFSVNMPSFDEWGLRPVGLVGPRENPVIVVPFFTAGAGLSPGDDAGEQAAMGPAAQQQQLSRYNVTEGDSKPVI